MNEPAIAQTFVDQSGDDFEFEIVDSEEQGQQQMADKDADALLLITASGDTLKGITKRVLNGASIRADDPTVIDGVAVFL